MITGEQLVFILTSEYPGLQHGRDFIAGHPCKADATQHGEAFILQWTTTAVARPDDAAVIALWPKYESAYAAHDARQRRDFLLQQCDWTQAGDVPQATREKWLAYRQALRDVPQQPGFPFAIDWPGNPAL
ncbi:hypothetical protein QF000_001706 [Paraburkholderia atlantica]|uniref:tail fiber assembly protein n=1 Tax=Paraburkholderia atlantica TaxID=2654982 RepID=UPI003D1A2372